MKKPVPFMVLRFYCNFDFIRIFIIITKINKLAFYFFLENNEKIAYATNNRNQTVRAN